MALFFDWMGYVARLQLYDPQRVTYKVFRYKDMRYVIALKAQFGHQTHGRRFHQWRLEWDIWKFMGPDWTNAALDERNFNWRIDAFLEWRHMRK